MIKKKCILVFFPCFLLAQSFQAPSRNGGGVGAINPSAPTPGTSTTQTVDITSLRINNMDSVIIGCKTASGVVQITGLSTIGSVPLTGVVFNYASAAGVTCTVNSNGGAGAAGTAGTAGAAGAAGVAGSTGPQGIQGITGLTGSAGAAGSTGPQGIQGIAGLTGSAGAAGTAGVAGVAGPSGPTGPTGSAGAAGTTGTPGTIGPTGPAGTNGAISTIKVAGITQTVRPNLNFVAGVTCVDNAGTSSSDCTGAGGGAGVTSVGLTVPGLIFSVAGSPVTTSGTLAFSLLNQTANTVFAGPASGIPAAPTLRALVAADIPNLVGAKIISAVATATALAALPTKCVAGSYPLGIDVSGNAQNCTVSGSGPAPFTGTFTGTGGLTILAATHGRVTPHIDIFDSVKDLVLAPININVSGDIIIGAVMTDTYTYVIR